MEDLDRLRSLIREMIEEETLEEFSGAAGAGGFIGPIGAPIRKRSKRDGRKSKMKESKSLSGQVVGDEVTVLPVYRVSVANDATTGIASSEIDVGSDYIDLPPRDGKTAARVTITQLLEQDPAMLVLQCQ